MIKLQFFPRLISGTFALFFVSLAAGSAPVLADCDVAPPQLADFSFSPAVIDVSSGPAGVTCDMTLIDALSGVAEATRNVPKLNRRIPYEKPWDFGTIQQRFTTGGETG